MVVDDAAVQFSAQQQQQQAAAAATQSAQLPLKTAAMARTLESLVLLTLSLFLKYRLCDACPAGIAVGAAAGGSVCGRGAATQHKQSAQAHRCPAAARR